MIAAGQTFTDVGEALGVSRQRAQQLALTYGIRSPRKFGFWKTESTERQWLWRILKGRVTDKAKRLVLYESLKDSLPAVCPIFKIPLIYEHGNGYRGENSASLDRLDSSKGYEVGNLTVICWRANRIKNNGTADEHFLISQYMKKCEAE